MRGTGIASRLAVILALTIPAAAQLGARELLTMPRLGGQITISPNGHFVAYLINRRSMPIDRNRQPGDASVAGLKETAELWVTDLRTNKSHRACCKEGNATSPAWSPDSQRLAFYKVKIFPGMDMNSEALIELEKDAALIVQDRQSGSMHEVLRGSCPYGCTYMPPVWLANGRSMIVRVGAQALNRVSFHRAATAGQQILGRTPKTHATLRVLETHVPQIKRNSESSSVASSELTRTVGWPLVDLVVIDSRSGKRRTILTNLHQVYSAVSPDHKRFIFADYLGNPPNSFFAAYSIHILDLESFQNREVLSEVAIYPGGREPFSWSPDARFVAICDQSPDRSSRETRAFSDYILLDSVTGLTRRLKADTPERYFGARPAVWNSNATDLSFIRNNSLETWAVADAHLISKVSLPNKRLDNIVSTSTAHRPSQSEKNRSLIVSVQDEITLKAGFWEVQPARGSTRMLTEQDKRFSYYSNFQQVLPDSRKVVFVWESVNRPADIFKADCEFKNIESITSLARTLGHTPMGASELVAWEEADGTELSGAVLLPPQFKPGRRYPMIVFVYPAPTMTSTTNAFGLGSDSPAQNWQMFATRGYLVFVPNIPTNPRTRMADIAKAVLPGVQRMVDLGMADPAKIGVVGHSDGGYATLALLVQSQLFRAAVVIDGSGNLLEQYSYDYGRRVIEESYGLKETPWDDLDVYIRNSPYYYLPRVHTPLLILHGSADTAVPVHFGEEVFAGLRRLGKEASYVEYDSEEHDPSFWTASHQLDVSKRMLAWFYSHFANARSDCTDMSEESQSGSSSRCSN